MKSYLAARDEIPKPAGQLDAVALQKTSPGNFDHMSTNRFTRSAQPLRTHTVSPNGDYVSNNTQIFSTVKWQNQKSIETEAGKHRELFHSAILEKVESLGTSKTGNSIRAYIYQHDHITTDPRQSRRSGDVIMIDEHQGLLAGFSRDGRIKTARVESPEIIRNYLQNEKHKDLERG